MDARVKPAHDEEMKPVLIVLAEPRGDERRQRFHHLGGFVAGRLHRDRGAGRGGEHHQAHDRGAADGFVAARHAHLGVEFFHRLHELRRGAGVQAFFVADEEDADQRVGGRRRLVGCALAAAAGRCAHLPVSTRLAMVTYLRPASWAAATASPSGYSARTLASLTSIGRLMPANTSTLGRLITEMARLDGVPPNMSVRMATPSPVSTRLTAAMMSLRRPSTSSSGPMVTASIWSCGPTTCSRAARNSTASLPWVTSTTPIIELLAGASRLHRTKGPPSWLFKIPAQERYRRISGFVALRQTKVESGFPLRRALGNAHAAMPAESRAVKVTNFQPMGVCRRGNASAGLRSYEVRSARTAGKAGSPAATASRASAMP